MPPDPLKDLTETNLETTSSIKGKKNYLTVLPQCPLQHPQVHPSDFQMHPIF
jgi:hypothetical protein